VAGGFESQLRHGLASPCFLSVISCVGKKLCDRPIPRQRSPIKCLQISGKREFLGRNSLYRRSDVTDDYEVLQSVTLHVSNYVTGKSKVALAHATKAYMGRRRTAPLILYRGNRWKWVVRITPRPLYPPKEHRHPFSMWLSRLQSRSGRSKEETIALPGPSSPQPIHYKDYVISAPVRYKPLSDSGKLELVFR